MKTATIDTTQETQREFIARFLDAHGSAAFYDGDMLITRNMKYRVMQIGSPYPEFPWYWEARSEQELSYTGFERNISNCTDSNGNWCDFVTFNTAADLCRVQWLARVNAEHLASEERQRKLQAEHDELCRIASEHRATIDAALASAKFKRMPVTITVDHDADLTAPYMVELMDGAAKSVTFAGLAIHKAQKQYRITHIASGLGTGLAYGSLTEAKVAVVRMATIADWTQDAKSIIAQTKGNTLMSTIRHNVYAS